MFGNRPAVFAQTLQVSFNGGFGHGAGFFPKHFNKRRSLPNGPGWQVVLHRSRRSSSRSDLHRGLARKPLVQAFDRASATGRYFGGYKSRRRQQTSGTIQLERVTASPTTPQFFRSTRKPGIPVRKPRETRHRRGRSRNCRASAEKTSLGF